MRTPLDRLRHALSFEIIALILVVPLGALAFDQPMHEIGVVGIVSALIAMGWNVVFNEVFDRIMKRRSGTTLKTGRLRVAHAILFEIGLLAVLMPFIAWYLGISLWQAFLMDISFAAFYLLYALAFNWAYDRLFPLAEWRAEKAARSGSGG
ncbi:PACE efflux transporter [Pseudoroseicyclus tamaricis]|uniref:PACE efflux transporter n=1 Tax=Pseudoroseicyclus tamaricis TaxID=2705421 RepID=A0A6B2JX89_9RHOB|nr:PACE efflux transporter [Pseudoroseicyclus tamaricis]NDV00854.1 PACE efflux transporter [Pseudoroseicyclus tamaricis]